MRNSEEWYIQGDLNIIFCFLILAIGILDNIESIYFYFVFISLLSASYYLLFKTTIEEYDPNIYRTENYQHLNPPMVIKFQEKEEVEK